MTAQPWSSSAHPAPPAPDEIHVWRIDLDAGPVSPGGALLLSLDEIERAGRLLCEDKRTRFIAGRSALRVLLAGYLGEVPQALTFRYGPRGKPALVAGASPPALFFNYSNSHHLGLLAVSTVREVGIDIEYRHRGISVAPLARHILSGSEAAAFQRLPPPQRKPALLATWTRKEAYVKALGVGLALPFKAFSVAVDDDGASAALLLDDGKGNLRIWRFAPLTPHPGYIACLAAPGIDWTPRCFDWRPVFTIP
jgi:4'-phosphopantetheinyl transferase